MVDILEDKYILIYKADANKYLSVSLREKLDTIIECIEFGRFLDKKNPLNHN
jgi:hypothetical protein